MFVSAVGVVSLAALCARKMFAEKPRVHILRANSKSVHDVSLLGLDFVQDLEV